MSDRPIPALAAAAQQVLAVLSDEGMTACVIGALAVHRWGQPRATADVDLSVLAPYGDEADVVDALLASFEARRADARSFALAHRVLLIRSSAGVGIDVALAAFPFEIEALGGSSAWEILPGISLRTCPAEHLIVYKLVAGRPHDLGDVEGIVRRQGRRLDISLVRRWLDVFAELKEDPDLARPFEDALRQAGLHS